MSFSAEKEDGRKRVDDVMRMCGWGHGKRLEISQPREEPQICLRGPGLYLFYLVYSEKDIHQRPDIYLENTFNTAGIITTVNNASGSKVMLH